MKSWSCSACTFLNPPSQSLSCQICNTPSSSSINNNNNPINNNNNNNNNNDNDVAKWECRACTYLNSYSVSICEICSTRASSTPLSIIDVDDYDDASGAGGAGSDVGPVFYPLRKCTASTNILVDDDGGGGEVDLGIKEKVKRKMGIDNFVNLCVSLSSKSKNTKDYDGDDLEMDQVNGSEAVAMKKEGFEEAAKCSRSVETIGKSKDSFVLKRKRDSSYIDVKSDQFDGFRDVKSSRDMIVEDSDDCLGLFEKELHNEDVKKPWSVEITDSKKGSIPFKRKRDLGGFDEEPIQVTGFRDVKSLKKPLSVSENTNYVYGTAMDEKVWNPRVGQASASAENAGNAEVPNTLGTIKILSYNVWFREDLEVVERMRAIGDLIQLHSPDVICFQEVTLNIYAILQRSPWWGKYHSLVTKARTEPQQYFCMQLVKLPRPVHSFSGKPFSNTIMERELCVARIGVDNNKSLVIATSHLESVCRAPPTWDQTFSKERVDQAKEAIRYLDQYPNVIFCGDMNWDEKLDGQFPLTEGWFDAWEKLRPSEVGWTHDTKSNKMLTGNRLLQKRLDRFVCRLPDFEVSSIDMIGTEAIPGLTYIKTKKLKNKTQESTLPVLPSDHYGLLLTMTIK